MRAYVGMYAYVCMYVCVCVYVRIYMRVCVCENIYNIPPPKQKKRVDPPSKATSQKSLFDPAKKINTVIKDYI